MSEFDPNEPNALDTPTPRVRPVARKGLPRTGTDPRAIARLAAQADAARISLEAQVPRVVTPETPPAAPASASHDAAPPSSARPAATPEAKPGRLPRGMGLPMPPPTLSAAEALEAARAAPPVAKHTPTSDPPANGPALAAAAPTRSPRRAPAAGPRGISVATPPRALSAAEAVEAARAAEAARVAAPATERALAGVTDEVRRALARAAEATTPHPLPADLPPEELLATVQALVDALVPDSDAWVVSVARADRRRDGGTWRAHRARATIVSDLGTALSAAIVLQAVETRARSLAYARVANAAGEQLLVVDVEAGRPLAVLANPLGWGVPIE